MAIIHHIEKNTISEAEWMAFVLTVYFLTLNQNNINDDIQDSDYLLSDVGNCDTKNN